MNLLTNGFIILLLLILTTAGGGAGCKTFFAEKKPPVKIKIATDREINQNWQEITPPEPLKATAKMHVVALRLRDAAGWTDEKEQRIRFKDGSETKIEIELIDEKGGVTTLFPNGFGEYVEFGKRAENKENPDEAYFQTGSRFTKIRLRSERSVKADEILWTEFEF